MLMGLRVAVVPLLEVPYMISVRGKLRRGAGVPGHLLPKAAHPCF